MINCQLSIVNVQDVMRKVEMKKIVMYLAAFGMLSSIASTVSAELVDRIVAVVNRKVITEYQLQEAEQQFLAQTGGTSQLARDERRQKVLNVLIENEIIRQKADDMGILVSDEELNAALYDIKERNQILSDEQLKKVILQEGRTWEEFLEEIRNQIKIAKLVNREVRSQIEISEEEVERYYQTHQNEFEQETPSVAVRHILLPLPENATAAEIQNVQAQSQQLVQELRAGADFAEMAKQFSQHPSAQNGGILGTFREGELAPPFAMAFNMEEGQISEPVRSDMGYHIIFVENKTGGQQASYEKAKTAIRRKLFEEKSAQLYQKWIEELKETAYIEKTS